MKHDKSGMTLRSSLWQRITALIVFGFIFIFGIIALFKKDQFLFCSGIIIVSFSLLCLLHSELYFLHADKKGISQRIILKKIYVSWNEVTAYRFEALRGTKECKIEPVLYGENDKLLLRPAAPLLVGTMQMDEERAQFWQFVCDQLPDKLAT